MTAPHWANTAAVAGDVLNVLVPQIQHAWMRMKLFSIRQHSQLLSKTLSVCVMKDSLTHWMVQVLKVPFVWLIHALLLTVVVLMLQRVNGSMLSVLHALASLDIQAMVSLPAVVVLISMNAVIAHAPLVILA